MRLPDRDLPLAEKIKECQEDIKGVIKVGQDDDANIKDATFMRMKEDCFTVLSAVKF